MRDKFNNRVLLWLCINFPVYDGQVYSLYDETTVADVELYYASVDYSYSCYNYFGHRIADIFGGHGSDYAPLIKIYFNNVR